MLRRMLYVFLGVLICVADGAAQTKPAEIPINVLLVNGRPGRDRLEQATELLRLALDPFDGKPTIKPSPIRPKVVGPVDFAEISDSDLAKFDCVALCDVPKLGKATAGRLEAYVRGGGGVMLCLGPQVDVDAYNVELFRDGKGLLPVRLLGPAKAKAKHTFLFAADENAFKGPPFASVEQVMRKALFATESHTIMRVSEPAAKSNARTIFTFEEVEDGKERGMPAGIAILAAQPFATDAKKGGRVVVITTTVHLEWTNWPLSVSYVVGMHQLTRFVAAEPRRGKPDPVIPRDAPPQVVLLPQQIPEADEPDPPGMPAIYNGRIPIAYYCSSGYPLKQARLRFRVVKTADNQPKPGDWQSLPLVEMLGNDALGAFDIARGAFDKSEPRSDVQFHAIPGKHDRYFGGGRFSFHLKGVKDLKVGDKLEFYIEVLDQRDKKPTVAGQSATRVTSVVDERDFVLWYQRFIEEEQRIRELQKRQKGLFPPKWCVRAGFAGRRGVPLHSFLARTKKCYRIFGSVEETLDCSLSTDTQASLFAY